MLGCSLPDTSRDHAVGIKLVLKTFSFTKYLHVRHNRCFFGVKWSMKPYIAILASRRWFYSDAQMSFHLLYGKIDSRSFSFFSNDV